MAYYLAGLFTRMRTNSEQAVKTVDSDVRALQHFVARYAPSKVIDVSFEGLVYDASYNVTMHPLPGRCILT